MRWLAVAAALLVAFAAAVVLISSPGQTRHRRPAVQTQHQRPVCRQPLLGLGCGHGPGIYVAEDSAGAADGTNCANPRSASWFDDGRNWGPSPGEIGAGTIVHLCGTISTPLIVGGSGTPGQPIVIYFEPGSSIAMPACPGRDRGCLNTNGQSHLTIDGGSDGTIESTANGTGLALHDNDVAGIWALDCTGCTIEGLTVRDMYVHSSATDVAADADVGIYFSGSGLRIADNTLHDTTAALVAEWNAHDANVRINDNNIYNSDHGFSSSANQAGGDIGPIRFYGNHVHAYANWDTTTAAYHHDGIHCYTSAGGSAAHYNGLYIYDNVLDGPTDLSGSPDGDDMTAQIFLEGGSGSGATPCADRTSKIWIFNNFLGETAFMNDGLIDTASGRPHVYNNTMLGVDATRGTCYASNSDATGGDFANNVMATCGTLIYNNDGARVYAAGNPDYNVYANGGENAFVCGGSYLPFTAFTQWQACIGGDRHSRTTSALRLNGDGSLSSGTPARGAGRNLTSLCSGELMPLCRGINGAPRPQSGAWDAGAY